MDRYEPETEAIRLDAEEEWTDCSGEEDAGHLDGLIAQEEADDDDYAYERDEYEPSTGIVYRGGYQGIWECSSWGDDRDWLYS